MKELKKIFKKTSFFIAISILVTLVFSVSIIYFLIYPRLTSYFETSSENSGLKQNVKQLEDGISAAKSLDKSEIQEVSSFINKYIPGTQDTLKLVTLNEVLAQSAGVKVKDVETNVSSSGVPSSSTQATPATQVPNQTSNKSYKLSIVVIGNFDNILKFIASYKNADRLVAVTDVTITQGDNALEGDLTLEVPLGASSASVTPGEIVSLTLQEKDLVNSIMSNIKYLSRPANNRLGTSNPFK